MGTREYLYCFAFYFFYRYISLNWIKKVIFIYLL
nr:MAG TPA: hypothetical protein [Caudoviricetes sp.]